MQVENSVYPNKEQLQGFAEPGPDGPIYPGTCRKLNDEQLTGCMPKASLNCCSNTAAHLVSAHRLPG